MWDIKNRVTPQEVLLTKDCVGVSGTKFTTMGGAQINGLYHHLHLPRSCDSKTEVIPKYNRKVPLMVEET